MSTVIHERLRVYAYMYVRKYVYIPSHTHIHAMQIFGEFNHEKITYLTSSFHHLYLSYPSVCCLHSVSQRLLIKKGYSKSSYYIWLACTETPGFLSHILFII